jgi:hypothetical protein
MLTIFDKVPSSLLTAAATDLHQVLPGPTLIRIEGDQDPPLFLSCLMHGNEHTGLTVVQSLLARYGTQRWPRSAYLFFGNVAAARDGRRHLDDQPDYNRVWGEGDSPEHRMAQQVLATVRSEGLFAAVDVHNNTGRNPHYTVLTRLEAPFLNLAALFCPRALHFGDGLNALISAMSDLCPSMAIEAGTPGEPSGIQATTAFVETLLQDIEAIPTTPPDAGAVAVLERVATIRIPEEASVGLGATEADFLFAEDLDGHNFQEVKAGTVIARHSGRYELSVTDAQGREVGDAYLDYTGGLVRARQALMPTMLTLDTTVMKSDCLCHLVRTR